LTTWNTCVLLPRTLLVAGIKAAFVYTLANLLAQLIFDYKIITKVLPIFSGRHCLLSHLRGESALSCRRSLSCIILVGNVYSGSCNFIFFFVLVFIYTHFMLKCVLTINLTNLSCSMVHLVHLL
jgi:hypothetical protein